ncbi:hypothetical protein V8E54_006763 [Elaphomyces granulatus]
MLFFNTMEAAPDGSFRYTSKRRRDDHGLDSLREDSLHESKKVRSMPFRTSPRPKSMSLFSQASQFPHRSVSPSLTPADSSDDEDGKMSSTFPSLQDGKHGLQRKPPMLMFDSPMDVDMIDSRPLHSGGSLSPWLLNADAVQHSPIPNRLINESLSISGGRTATPIYGHFTVNMRPDAMVEDSPLSAPAPASLDPPRDEIDWWRRRRLPSPISEDEDGLNGLAEAVRMNDRGCSDNIQLDQHPELPVGPSLLDSNFTGVVWSATPKSSKVMYAEDQRACDAYREVTMPLRTRNSSEDITGRVANPDAGSSVKGKISFSMGYRADCMKCQLKVPGHYNHIIRS